jgi:molybdenum cofactor cytidylyltransferase
MAYSAVIAAAGLSSRMGKLKPLLPLGDRSALQREIDAFLAYGSDRVVVVTGYRNAEVAGHLALYADNPRVCIAYNPCYFSGMFSSVQTGVRALPAEAEAFFFLPADCPCIHSDILQKIDNVYQKEKKTVSVIHPVFEGKRGHPPLIAGKLIPEILGSKGENGLKGILSQHPFAEAAIPDAGILLDMDTPEEYETLRQFFETRDP